MQLFEGNRDLEVVSQHMEGCEDVSPLHHLPQWAPLQHLGAEDIPRLLCQKAHVDEDLKAKRKEVKSVWFVKALLLLPPQYYSKSNNRQLELSTAENNFSRLPEFMYESPPITAADRQCQIQNRINLLMKGGKRSDAVFAAVKRQRNTISSTWS